MAISEDTKAIVSQLEQNAELMRSSNEDSNREVHVRLDKFAAAFVSISANIKAQNQMLQTSEKASDERLERERADRDFDDLKRDKGVREANRADLKSIGSGLKDAGAAIAGGIGNVFKGGLVSTIGNVIKAGLAGFVGYNFIKGFLGPKYDSMFESFESLLTSFTVADIPKAIQTMTESVTEAAEAIKNNIDTTLNVLGGAVAILTSLKAYFMGRRMGNALNNRFGTRGGRGDGYREVDTRRRYREQLARDRAEKKRLKAQELELERQRIADLNANRPDAIDLPGNSNGPDVKKTSPFITTPNYTPPRKFGNYETNDFLQNKRINQKIFDATNNGKGLGRNTVGGPGKGHPGAYLTQAQMDEVLRQMGQQKLFKLFVKGAAAVGFVWSAYETYKLYNIFISTPPGPEGDAMRKQLIIDGFASAIGGMLGGVAGGLIGIFGGPWGILIGSVIGSLAGSAAGPIIVGYIFDWANEKPLTEKQSLEELDRQISKLGSNLDQMMLDNAGDPFAGAYMTGATLGIRQLTERRNEIAAKIATKQFSAQSMQNNQISMETAAYGRGGRAMYEVATNGTTEQKSILLDALIEVNRGHREFFQTLEDFMQTTHTTVINAPNNSSTIMAPVGGAVTKNDVNVLNTNSGSYSPHSSFGLPYSLN